MRGRRHQPKKPGVGTPDIIGATVRIFMRQPPELVDRVRAMAGPRNFSAVVRSLLEEWTESPADNTVSIRVPMEDVIAVRTLLYRRALERTPGMAAGS